MNNHTTIPVTILTGFLGSGKTTLLNRLLAANPNKRFAIIENEVGEINIDSSLIRENKNAGVYELTNGCICCSINADLGIALNSIIVSGKKFDHLIVEATGIASPVEVIRTFTQGNRVKKYFKLNSVICLVDARNYLQQLLTHEETRQQSAWSDVILINKTDLASDKQTEEIETTIMQINPFATIFKTQYTEALGMDLLATIDPNSFKTEQGILSFQAMRPAQKNIVHNIQTIAINVSGSFEQNKIAWWLDGFLFTNATNVLRIKGIISIADIPHRLIIQSTGGTEYQVEKGSDWENQESRFSKIVIIGTNLNGDQIKENIQALVKKT